jgi:uncharacterized alkaline shock family protein YloU
VSAPIPDSAPAGPPPGDLDRRGDALDADAAACTADEVAGLVLSVPGVVRLHAGVFGEAATYLPGRRVSGVRLGDDVVEVHVVVATGVSIRDVAQHIHSVVGGVVTAPVHVLVEDVDPA